MRAGDVGGSLWKIRRGEGRLTAAGDDVEWERCGAGGPGAGRGALGPPFALLRARRGLRLAGSSERQKPIAEAGAAVEENTDLHERCTTPVASMTCAKGRF